MGAVPTALEMVDAPWLRAHVGWDLDSVEIEPLGAGVGFIGRLARLHLHGGDDIPATVIVKLPTDDPGGRMLGEMMRLWEREHHFYEHVAPLLDVRVPTAHVNLHDAATNDAVLVLEDLHPLVVGDQLVGATLEQAELVIDRLAAFHAQWWQHPDLAGLEWMPSIVDPMVEMVGPMFAAGWPGFCDRYGDSLPDRAIGWSEAFVELIPRWLASYRDKPWTIGHGDARLDNMFFGEADAGDGFALIDWQMAMRGPSGGDLAYFVLTNLDVETRRHHERSLIERYATALVACGVDESTIDPAGLWTGYLEGVMFYCVSFASSLLTLDPANERGLELIDAMVTRTFTAADDLDVGELVIPAHS